MGETFEKIYLGILVEFLLELFVYTFLTSLRLKRRKRFLLRLLAGAGVILAATLPITFLYVAVGNSAFGRIAVYLFLFALTMLYMFFCYDAPIKTILTCGGLGYAAQNFTYKLFVFLWCFGEALSLFNGWGAEFGLYYKLIYYPFYALVTVGVYFAVLRPITKRLASGESNTSMLVLSMVVLVVTVILCSFEDVYFATLSAGRENRFSKSEYYVLRQAGNAMSLICLAVVTFLISLTAKERDLVLELQYLQHTVSQGEWQYKMSKDIVDMINVKCHDIKYKLNSVLSGGGQIAEDAITDLNESIRIYDATVDTGNPILNVMFSEKRLYCEQNGINFSCMADGNELSFIEDGDLYCLFGNILDNALEAVRKIPEKSRRVINIVVKKKNGTVLIQEENYFDGTLTFDGGLPVTTKPDKNYHGFGMRSIDMLVKKYDGVLSTYVSGDVFHLNVIFDRTVSNE